MKKEKLNSIINNKAFVIGVMGLLFGVIYYLGIQESNQYRSDILKNPTIVNGAVIEAKSKQKLGVVVKYKFEFNYSVYYDETSSSGYASVKHLLANRTFPVIVNVDNPEKNKILILPEDFKNYDLAFPDSLSWLTEVVESSKWD
ncbi:MAG TPA: hypothetical protein VD794_07715 [Flavisolibacter sp.]|nr:hypothetical protein [Flavisolibacter sp.]